MLREPGVRTRMRSIGLKAGCRSFVSLPPRNALATL